MGKVQKIKYTKEFLEKVQNGDNQATSLLYENAKTIAYNRAMNILNNHHDAEDIAEESFIKALEKLDTLKKPSDFPAWIGRIADNKAKDFIKKNKPMLVDENFDYTTNDSEKGEKVSPEKVAESKENKELYKKLVSKLTDDQRTAIVLNRIEGYKFREIAEMLGTSESTIKSRVRQAEKKLTKEAEKLKEQGYTLNGMLPLDFFTIMSKSLGVTASNVASVIGTTAKSLSLKAMTSIVVAIVMTFSGLLGCNLIYNMPEPQQMSNTQPNTSSKTIPTNTNLSTSKNHTFPSLQSSSALEKVTTIVPISANQQQYTIPVKVTPETIPVYESYNYYQITSNNESTSESNSSTTISTSTTPIYYELKSDDISYIKTLLYYVNSSDDISNEQINNFSKITDTQAFGLLKGYDCIKEYCPDYEDFFPSASVSFYPREDIYKSNKIPLSVIRCFLQNCFGKILPQNIEKQYKGFASNGYCHYELKTNEVIERINCNIQNITYSSDKSIMTVTYTCDNHCTSDRMDKKRAIFKKNYGDKNYPYTMVSNSTVDYEQKEIVEYEGETIDFGKFTIKVPNSWSYEYDSKNGLISFYEPKTKQKCGKGLIMKLLSSSKSSIADKYLTTSFMIFSEKNNDVILYIPATNNQAYKLSNNAYPSKEWQDVYDNAYKLIFLVLKSMYIK